MVSRDACLICSHAFRGCEVPGKANSFQINDAIESLPNLFYLAHRMRYPRTPTDTAVPPRNRALIGDSPPPLH